MVEYVHPGSHRQGVEIVFPSSVSIVICAFIPSEPTFVLYRQLKWHWSNAERYSQCYILLYCENHGALYPLQYVCSNFFEILSREVPVWMCWWICFVLFLFPGFCSTVVLLMSFRPISRLAWFLRQTFFMVYSHRSLVDSFRFTIIFHVILW